jgi:hypothetical protein
MYSLSAIAVRCCAALAMAVACFGIARAGGGPRVVSLEVCIDGLDNLHLKGGQLRWEHLAYERPGLHVGCKGVSDVDGVPWTDWSKSFPLQHVPSGANIAFHPVRCRGNCVLVQSPSAANGWEAIYQFDDYAPGSSSIYCVNIVIGGLPEPAADQSVQHIPPAPRAVGGRPLFDGPGGRLRDEACAQKPVS